MTAYARRQEGHQQRQRQGEPEEAERHEALHEGGERDITQYAQALENLSRLGYMTTPVTVIDGEAVVGFDQKRPEEMLG